MKGLVGPNQVQASTNQTCLDLPVKETLNDGIIHTWPNGTNGVQVRHYFARFHSSQESTFYLSCNSWPSVRIFHPKVFPCLLTCLKFTAIKRDRIVF